MVKITKFKRTESEYKKVAKQHKQANPQEGQTLAQVFWSGFFWPLRTLWSGIIWALHHFPLKHIGHALRRFFMLPPLRFVGRLLGFRYIRDSWKELRQVTWPTFRESRRLTLAVIIFSIIFGLIIAVVDYGLDKVFKPLLTK